MSESDFLDGLSNDGQLFGIIDACTDASGHVSFSDVEAYALATGHHTPDEIGILDALVRNHNDSVVSSLSESSDIDTDELDELVERAKELDIDPEDYDSADDLAEAVSNAEDKAEINITISFGDDDDDSWRDDGCDLGDELGLDPEDYKTVEEYVAAIREEIKCYDWDGEIGEEEDDYLNGCGLGDILDVDPEDYSCKRDYIKAVKEAARDYEYDWM